MTRSQFIDRYKLNAVMVHLLTGVPASVNLAISAIESGNGNSKLSTQANNYHGIKSTGNTNVWTTNEVINGQTITIRSNFAEFNTPYGSFKGFANFLNDNKRYADTLAQKDFINFSNELKKAGYATAPNYATSIQNVIKDNDLYKLDFWGNNRFVLLILLLALITYVVITIKNKK